MGDENIILSFDPKPDQVIPDQLLVRFIFDNNNTVETKIPYRDAKETLAAIAQAWRAKTIFIIPDRVTAATTVIDMSKIGIVNIIPIV